MFSSFLGGSSDSKDAASSASPAGGGAVGQVHPPKERLSSPEATFGPLNPQDTSWLCAGGFTTETQTFYAMTAGQSPKLLMVQVIHSAVGMWYPQIQFTFRLYDPVTGKPEWRSTNVTNFVTAPSTGTKYDKRSCKSDQFSILLDPAHPDTYTIEGNYDANTQVSLKFKRAEGAPGWKLGMGPKGGMTYFGAEKAGTSKDKETPDGAAGTDGYVVHRFWPRCIVSGIIRMGNEVVSLDNGSRGIFIHAIQGMRPNLVACRWNFGYFNSTDEKEGVSLVMMEFTTTSSYGNQVINIGSVVVDDRLVAVTANGTAKHLDTEPIDSDTSYPAPGKIQWDWGKGRCLLPTIGPAPNNTVEASILLDMSPKEPAAAGQPRKFSGLIEKVDVLAQIPYLVKKVISYVAGTKPYIYQFHNPTTAKISLPSSDGSEVRELSVEGYQFTEATFVSAH